ncbi:MAG: PfkB family carbohydrate kinase [Solirubrobacterales bacterium]
MFAELINRSPAPISVLSAESTSSFILDYDGDARVTSVGAIGDQWTVNDVARCKFATEWIHIAPLLRDEFGAETLAAIVADGHRISLDGQGLVRPPALGELILDHNFDPEILASISILKLASEEADALAGGVFDKAVAERLGIPEILVTFGSEGCALYVDGTVSHVPPAAVVSGVHATGAGDCFTVAYVAARTRRTPPREAAKVASLAVVEMLEERSGR